MVGGELRGKLGRDRRNSESHCCHLMSVEVNNSVLMTASRPANAWGLFTCKSNSLFGTQTWEAGSSEPLSEATDKLTG